MNDQLPPPPVPAPPQTVRMSEVNQKRIGLVSAKLGIHPGEVLNSVLDIGFHELDSLLISREVENLARAFQEAPPLVPAPPAEPPPPEEQTSETAEERLERLRALAKPPVCNAGILGCVLTHAAGDTLPDDHEKSNVSAFPGPKA